MTTDEAKAKFLAVCEAWASRLIEESRYRVVLNGWDSWQPREAEVALGKNAPGVVVDRWLTRWQEPMPQDVWSAGIALLHESYDAIHEEVH